MKLVKLNIKNFRGIGLGTDGNGTSIDLEEQNIVFLIGKNNAGKSSILEAYSYFMSNEKAQADDFHNKGDEAIEISLQLRTSDSDREEMEQLQLMNENLILKQAWPKVGSEPQLSYATQLGTEEFKPLRLARLAKKNLLERLPQPIWVRGTQNSQDVLSDLQNLIKKAILDNLSEDETYIQARDEAEQAIQKLQELVRNHEYSNHLSASISSTLREVFPDISVSLNSEGGELNLAKIVKDQTKVKAFEKEKPAVDIQRQGHGVQRHFILSTYKECSTALSKLGSKGKKELDYSLDSENSDRILLIEEPELFLHPSGVRSLKRLLYEIASTLNFQILCATHSPVLIDLSQPHRSLVRAINCSESGTCVHQVDTNFIGKNGAENLRMIRAFNSSVCEAFFADHVLLVEGPTEYMVIQSALEKFEEHGFEKTDELTVIDCGGKTTIPLFQRILTRFQIAHYILHDLDSPQDKNGKDANVWKLNNTIWNGLEAARKQGLSVRRFIFENNFESAHQSSHPEYLSGGKPYSAWMQVQEWKQSRCWKSEVEKQPILKFLSQILTGNFEELEHDQEWVNARRNEAPCVDEPSPQLELSLQEVGAITVSA